MVVIERWSLKQGFPETDRLLSQRAWPKWGKRNKKAKRTAEKKKKMPPVRIELTTFRLWDWRAAYCAKEACTTMAYVGIVESQRKVHITLIIPGCETFFSFSSTAGNCMWPFTGLTENRIQWHFTFFSCFFFFFLNLCLPLHVLGFLSGWSVLLESQWNRDCSEDDSQILSHKFVHWSETWQTRR